MYSNLNAVGVLGFSVAIDEESDTCKVYCATGKGGINKGPRASLFISILTKSRAPLFSLINLLLL